MSVQFTASQESAISYRGEKPLLISASAGSGKTTVLVERILRKVIEGTDVSRFLVITFTRNAAAKLRSDIIEALNDKLSKVHGDEEIYFRRQVQQAYTAQISTIHSFCGTLLREFAQKLEIRPDFRQMENAETAALREKILGELLDSYYDSESPEFLKLADIFSGTVNDEDFADSLLAVYDRLQSLADPRERLERAINGSDNEHVDYLLRHIAEFADKSLVWLTEERTLLNSSIYKKALGCLDYTIDALTKLRGRCGSWDDVREVLFGGCDIRWSAGITDEVTAGAKFARDTVKNEWNRFRDEIWSAAEKTLAAEDASADELSRAFFTILRDFGEVFAEEKKARGALDFADLEHLTIKLLRNPEVAARAASRYSEILVDEFQDINPAQDELFTLLRNGASAAFTAVGDIKQSIYRFRRADPGIFLNYFDSPDFEVIYLQENFRSTAEIIGTVNTVFRSLMSKEFGDIDYNEKAELKPGREFPVSFTPRLIQINTPVGGERIPHEAKYAAQLIHKLITEEGYAYSDISIILRATKDKSLHYVNALRAYGIPASDSKRSDFFARDEIMLLLSYLQIIDNPRQDVPLIAVLCSPLYLFDPSELAEIRESKNGVSFYEAVWEAQNSKNEILAEKCNRFLLNLRDLRVYASDVTSDRLISKIDEYTHFTDIYAGADSRELYVRLLNTAASFESNGYKGLFLFLQRLAQMKAASEEPPGAAGASDSVIIQSVHSSKGLEYKVVIAADLAGEFAFLRHDSDVLFHPQIGLGIDITDKKRGTKHISRRKFAIAELTNSEEFAEAQRLLYVMLTRAEERLYILASITRGKTDWTYKNLEVLNPLTLKSVNKPRDWLLNILDAEIAEFTDEALPVQIPQVSEPAEEEALPAEDKIPRLVSVPVSIVPTKLSASQLKGDDNTFRGTVFSQPNFLKGKELSATDKGTALHLAMQHIDFAKTSTLADIRSDIERQRLARYLTDEQAAVVDADKLLSFFASTLGAEVLAAKRSWRELRFSLLVPAGILGLEHIPEDVRDTVILQGIADLCFETSQGLTIVDFKTDHISAEQLPARIEYYRGQLKAYEIALSRVLKIPVTRSVIYFFSIERAEYL
ncbi:MAG: UvrD-helicase domain-containing protein [Oscillospiraceae bacterium]|jgi:ATP-dependent helicase/nuclease subunit A|nr:UvrD-helicase domain-containing protein [Oscillospiraceae bacterium]